MTSSKKQVRHRPTQIWLPAFNNLLSDDLSHQHDMERAVREWRGETIVWLRPDINEVVRWLEEGHGNIPAYAQVAVPAKRFDRIAVYHMGDNGKVWGPNARKVFPNSSVTGLLEAWLDLRKGDIEVVAPRPYDLSIPVIENDKVKIKNGRVLHQVYRVQAGAGTPQRGTFDFITRTFESSEASEEIAPHSISRVADLRDRHGEFEVTEETLLGYQLSQSVRDSRVKAIHGHRTVIGEPLRSLLGWSGWSADFEPALERMRKICELGKSDKESALNIAKAQAGAYIGVGLSSLEFLWYFPRTVGHADMPKHAFDEAISQFFKDDDAMLGDRDTAFGSTQWNEKMNRPMEIRRAWGTLGLMWALMIDQFERNNGVCIRCGKLLPSDAGPKQQQCRKRDDPWCFKEYEAEKTARARAPKL